MHFDEIATLTRGVPHMTSLEGRVMYDFITTTGPQSVLELGFSHGVSTSYMAAALEQNGLGGHVTSIDLKTARANEPNIETLLTRAGLTGFVTAVYAHSTYVWELMRIIERQTSDGVCEPCFDFCFIDGAHSWAVDGFAFFLVDKLLQSGGWLLFDDLCWTVAEYHAESRRGLADEEREMCETAQLTKVFDLLVRQHGDYGNIRADDRWGGGWGWAQKDAREADTGLLESIYAAQPLRSHLHVLGRRFKRSLRSGS